MIDEGRFGQIIEVEAGFWHASDLDPAKPINWKRHGRSSTASTAAWAIWACTRCHMPFRAGWWPANVRALLSNIVNERPDGKGGMVPCDTWDNAMLACDAVDPNSSEHVPDDLAARKRIAPGETNTWFIKVHGTEFSAEFSHQYPQDARTDDLPAGGRRAGQRLDMG